MATLDRRTCTIPGNERYPFVLEAGLNNAKVYKAWELDPILSRACSLYTADEGVDF
jgi:hypothetical protein